EQVAENNRFRRADLLTGSLESVGVGDLNRGRCAGLDLLRNLRLLDALDAEGAFLYDAAHAHGHVRILGELHQVVFELLALGQRAVVELARTEHKETIARRVREIVRALVEVEIVEAAYLIRAVVRAIPRADAAVVGHRVDAFLVVHGGVDGTNTFARRA